jgi:hypothetical protein
MLDNDTHGLEFPRRDLATPKRRAILLKRRMAPVGFDRLEG